MKVLFVNEIKSFNWSHFECFNKSKMNHQLIFACGFSVSLSVQLVFFYKNQQR